MTRHTLKVLSLFSGCGGMDIGFEGGFVCHSKSIPSKYVSKRIDNNWVQNKKLRFSTIFANDILPEAKSIWTNYMQRFRHKPSIYHIGSIVDLVKAYQSGNYEFPKNVDVVTGGFPCQDFSVAGKRKGFDSSRDHNGNLRLETEPSEETRGKLYFWMKQVIDITKPKIFIAENVKGLINLGDVKTIIQNDFANAADGGYIVLPPKVLHAGNYGVPESRERVIFIGIKKSALNKRILDILSTDIIPDEFNPYPKPTHACTIKGENLLPFVTCRDIFCDLSEPEQSKDLSHINYSKAKFMGYHCQGQKEINIDNIAPTIRSEHHGNIEFRRLSKEHGGTNYKELDLGLEERRLTPRECALIQTFPPDLDFVIKGANTKKLLVNTTNAYRVIGNAVPPILAYNIAIRLQELWDIYFENNG